MKWKRHTLSGAPRTVKARIATGPGTLHQYDKHMSQWLRNGRKGPHPSLVCLSVCRG